jgi:hypothetical protein
MQRAKDVAILGAFSLLYNLAVFFLRRRKHA